jgi:hypothetical protein
VTAVALEQSWCPSCNEWTTTDLGRPCVWCDTRTVRRKGGWKRPDRHARSLITAAQARALHQAHRTRSLRDLSRSAYQALGYSTPNSCLEGIRAAFDREGLTGRDQPTATAQSNVARSTRLPGETKNEFKRRRRREHGYRCSRTGEWRVAASEPALVQVPLKEAGERSDEC